MKYLVAEGHYNPLARAVAPDFAVGVFRGIRLIIHLLYGAALACAYPLLALPGRHAVMRHWSRSLLQILHVHLELRGQLPATRGGALIVSNHVSWLDIVAMNSASPSRFIAKSDVRSWPVIGPLCSLTGTIFIARHVRRDAWRVNREIGQSLARGESVALFPEGTSSNGASVGHFHSALLQGAIDAAAPIHPAVIRYHDGAGRRCDDAAFIGDTTFAESLRKVLCARSLHVTLVFLPALCTASKNRRTVADEAHAAISAALERLSPQPHATPENVQARTPHRALLPQQHIYSLLLDTAIFRARRRENLHS